MPPSCCIHGVVVRVETHVTLCTRLESFVFLCWCKMWNLVVKICSAIKAVFGVVL